ncbi:34611_t:CDS:2 [Racocetra persica]|uniref:34611_t:CDS:1 n=1 Tax=Racocetra persica TaxID=160502 RepID=A0ACA9RTR6_9GLOM|nr:34611_t:CDS:2 [Racocetra persica]
MPLPSRSRMERDISKACSQELHFTSEIISGADLLKSFNLLPEDKSENPSEIKNRKLTKNRIVWGMLEK